MEIDLDVLTQAVRSSTRLISQNQKEQVLRDTFTSFLRNLYPVTPWWVEDHIQRCESNTHVTIHGKGKQGFVDNLVGRTVIEYERNLRTQTSFDSGYSQLKEYSASLIRAGNPIEDVLAILSDTVIWFAYEVRIVDTAAGMKLCDIEPQHILLEEVCQVTASADEHISIIKLGNFLSKYLGRIGSRPLSANFISRDLGFDSFAYKQQIEQINALVETALNAREDYGMLIKSLWENFVVYIGDTKSLNKFDSKTYASELYILTLAKLICANCVAERGLISNPNEIVRILNGKFFQSKGISNLVDYDYFGWLNEAPAVERIIPVAQSIQHDLQAYDYKNSIGEDLFGGLMSELATRSQRLLLGQEWTPSWLARQMVERMIHDLPENELPRFIDMCCGSGTIAVEVISNILPQLNDMDDNEAVNVLESAFTGFDIDPMAVLLAKVSWLLAAKRRIPLDGTMQLTIPVFNADSLFTISALSKTLYREESQEFLTLKLAEFEVLMPSFLLSPQFSSVFDRVIDSAYKYAMTTSKLTSYQMPQDIIGDCISRISEETNTPFTEVQVHKLIDFLNGLIHAIDALQRKGLNGLWAFLIRNSYRPALVFGNFNGLVSNPPWLTLSKISNNPYKKVLKDKARSLNVLPQGASHPHTEMSTIFLLHALDKYLSEGAVFGCILPETILNGRHQQGFRDSNFSRSNLNLGIDLKEIWRVESGVFKNESVVLFGKKAPSRTALFESSVPGKRVSSKLDSIAVRFYEAKLGELSAWSENLRTNFLISENNYSFHQGADLMPRSLYFVEAKDTDRSSQSIKLISVEGIRKGSKKSYLVGDSKKCKSFRLSNHIVPEEFVFKAFISKHLTPFTLAEPDDVLLPTVRTSNGWNSISEMEIIKWPGLSAAFSEIQDAYQEEYDLRVSLEGLLNTIDTDRRKLSTDQRRPRSGYLILFGAGGANPCAAYKKISKALSSRLVIDQTLYWSEVETEDEAAYLVGIINSIQLKKIISAFQPRGQQGERHIHTLPLKAISDFNPKNPNHIDLSEAVKSLVREWQEHLNTFPNDAELLNPGKNLALRRRAVTAILESLGSFSDYARALKRLYE